MSAEDDRGRHPEPPSLDDEITTTQADRRSFLTRALGGTAGVMALLAIPATGCGERLSDVCDSDIVDNDPTDVFGGDKCDSD